MRRHPIRSRLIGLALALTVIVLMAGGLPANHAHAQATGTLRVGWTAPTKLDPALFSDAPDISIGVAVYDYLFTLDQKSNLVKSLVTDWKISDDGKTYTISLQKGVKFHDGSDFTADDVKFTLDRLQDPALKSGAAGLFSGVSSIDVVDPQTVKFTLKAPNVTFLDALADYHTAILKKGTKDPATEMNGTGPFVKGSVDLTSRVELTANPNYWKGAPKIAKLQFIYVSAAADLVPALHGGQVDWVARLPLESYQELKTDSKLVVGTSVTNGFSNVRIRADRKPGSDPNVRKALRLAIDRAALNQITFQGLAGVGNDNPVGPLYGSLIDAKAVAPARDVATAKKLIADAGYPNGLSIDFAVPKGEEGSDTLATVLQQQWKEANINVNLKVIDQSVYYGDDKSPLFWLNADLAVTFWASRPDPQAYLDQLYKSGADYNEAHYSNPDLDKLIDQARAETDATKRAGIFSQIQKLLIDDGPSYIPYFQPVFYAQAKNVSGITISPDPGLTSFATATVG